MQLLFIGYIFVVCFQRVIVVRTKVVLQIHVLLSIDIKWQARNSLILFDIVIQCILWSRFHLCGLKSILCDQYSREELILICNPFETSGFFSSVCFHFGELLYVATNEHILQLCVFFLELTSFLLLRN